VTSKGGPDEVTGAAVGRFGRLDCAVNAAGVEGGEHPLDACTDEEFDVVMGVNVRGLFRCMRAQLRQMYRQGSGFHREHRVGVRLRCPPGSRRLRDV
jgi:NAD(P)-dependent dehydrogenase (short-subunit alcohol dehydrogenase family)